jgi:hypothetical protein
MTGVTDPESGRTFSDDELAWVSAHMDDLRRTVAERRIRNWMLWTGLGFGLVAHVAGFLLKASVSGEPIGVLADLLYTLGWALWSGVVVVALIEIIPAAKERQISRAIDVYEAALHARAREKADRSTVVGHGAAGGGVRRRDQRVADNSVKRGS